MGGSWAYKWWRCAPHQTGLLEDGNCPVTWGIRANPYPTPISRQVPQRVGRQGAHLWRGRHRIRLKRMSWIKSPTTDKWWKGHGLMSGDAAYPIRPAFWREGNGPMTFGIPWESWWCKSSNHLGLTKLSGWIWILVGATNFNDCFNNVNFLILFLGSCLLLFLDLLACI